MRFSLIRTFTGCLATCTLSMTNLAAFSLDKQSLPAPADSESEASSGQRFNERLESLDDCLKNYQRRPDSLAWERAFREGKELLSFAVAKHIDFGNHIKSLKVASDLGFKEIAAPGVKVFCFTKVPDASELLMQWQQTAVSTIVLPVGKHKRPKRTTVATTVIKMATIACPLTTVVNDVQLFYGSARSVGNKGLGKSLVLTISGTQKGGLAWLAGFKLQDGTWAASPEIFSGLPPFLLQNVPGKVVFDQSRLIFYVEAIGAAVKDAQALANTPGALAQASGYQLILRFNGERFVLEGKGAMDAPTAVALAFTQAIESSRPDLVKAWLIDAKLASIPNYLGLYKRTGIIHPLKLVAMASPVNGGARYRLVTFDKDDLIVDIGKVKNQNQERWAVKALFIAPDDALARQMATSAALSEQSAELSAKQEK